MRKTKVVGVIVARMGSSRVPGKALLDVGFHGTPLDCLISNFKDWDGLNDLVVATSDLLQDDPIKAVCDRHGVKCFRGNADLVLDRIYGAARELNADVVVEIGGDCPFFSPEDVQPALACFFTDRCDYLNNYEPPTFPEGFDINIVTIDCLKAGYDNALAPSHRIHPFHYQFFHAEKFKISNFSLESGEDLSRHHWSLDFPEDIPFVTRVFELIGAKLPTLSRVRELILQDPVLFDLDRGLLRNDVSHSFFNAPKIVQDMHSDIEALARMAIGNRSDGFNRSADYCYEEIVRICNRLIGNNTVSER